MFLIVIITINKYNSFKNNNNSTTSIAVITLIFLGKKNLFLSFKIN